MQPPVASGTILQNRYRLIRILGQGGFGRTYLAEDQGRFNELCALKELIPNQSGAYALEKSKELFQREAQILYQIQHPQVPQFRATFEQDQRLFLVQDYVEGKTYRNLLDERKARGYAFAEAEVVQLMRQLLPVLAHLHTKGIIHRDIAPDNIILRDRDQLPVLIDFGVVKELATRIQSLETVHQSTSVGKLGYAPSEQMQTGRAYPSSDLYSLAVTVVVLLTGQEPQALFDDNTMLWHWQRWVTVSPAFAQVLNRMLSYKPGDRYQSVSEVVQALQSMPGNGAIGNVPSESAPTGSFQPAHFPTQPVSSPPPVAPVPPVVPPDHSQVPTMAVGRRPAPIQPPTHQPDPVIPTATRSSFWDDPWAVGLIGVGLVLLTGIGSWATMSLLLNRSAPTTSPSATIASPSTTPSPTVSKTPTPSPEPVTYSQRLDIVADARVTKEGTLKANETVTYIIPAEQGQKLTASLSGSEGVLMQVLAPNKTPVFDQAQRVTQWQGILPFTGNYYIQLSPVKVKGLSQSSYKLDINLTNPVKPSPSPTESPTAGNPIAIEVGEFQNGQFQTEISGRIEQANFVQPYLINLEAGQTLITQISAGASLAVRLPNGQLASRASESQFQLDIDAPGAYQIDVSAPGQADYVLTVQVRDNVEPPPDEPAPTP